jgi:crotonobetainyl-CoA:carnitine CoA-transferase CaiB-like acyl-CoA transferase
MAYLDGLRVLDCTDERGLLAGRLLADLGADVVQVEPPGGSPARRVLPRSGEASLYWDTYAANKRGIVCDLDTEEGRADFHRLVAAADFLFESSAPGSFHPAELRRINPRLVHVSITPFGSDGPKANWATTDLTVWASGGPLAYNRDEVGPPLRISVPQAYLHAAADAAGGALIAHFARRQTGAGQHVDVAAQASLGLATLAAALTAVTGDDEPDWIPNPGGGVTIDQSGSGSRTRRSKWPVKDGFVELHLAMGPAVGAFTNNFFAWLRDEDACPDPTVAAWDWRELPALIQKGSVGAADLEQARAAVGSFLETKTKQEVTEAALARKLLSVEIADVGDLVTSAHLADRGFFVELGGDGRPRRTMPGPVAQSSSGGFVFRRPAPLLGEHDEEVRREWTSQAAGGDGPAGDAPAGSVASTSTRAGTAQPASAATQPASATTQPASATMEPASATTQPAAAVPATTSPLGWLKVADLSWVVAGPVVGRALADFGATVIRVESSAKVETARHMAPFYGGRHTVESSALYINTNAGKQGLALDLATEAGRAVVRDLARWADILIESYAPGLMQRWGLGYEQLAADNPGLIMLSSSLMGNTGRFSRLAGYGNVGAAMGGFQYIVGWPDRPPLGPFGPYTDFVAPRLALVALLAALEDRQRTGRGCYLDVSQVESGVWFLAPEIAAFAADGVVQGRVGNRDATFVPHGVFACQPAARDQADHVAIAIRDDADFAALVRLMGRPELATDPRLSGVAARRAAEDELEAMINDWTSIRTAPEVEAACQAVGVPAHRASTSADFVSDPQLAHRGHLIRLPHPVFDEVVVEAPRYVLSDTPGSITKVAPAIGQDSVHVLRDILRYPPEKVAELDQQGVLK